MTFTRNSKAKKKVNTLFRNCLVERAIGLLKFGTSSAGGVARSITQETNIEE